MNNKRSIQIYYWFMYVFALAVGAIFNFAIGWLLMFSTLAVRETLNENKFGKQFMSENAVLVFICTALMLFFSLKIFYISVFTESENNMEIWEYLLPLCWFLPVVVVYEYELYKRNV